MRITFRHGAIAFALLAFAGLAIAVIPTGAADETTGRNSPTAAPALSLEDESRIFERVMRIPDVPVANIEPPEPPTPLPRTIALQDLPADATRDVPSAAGYKFVKLEDWLLLVNPASRLVVAQMPRYKLMQ